MGYLLRRVIYEIREDVLLTNTNDHLEYDKKSSYWFSSVNINENLEKLR